MATANRSSTDIFAVSFKPVHPAKTSSARGSIISVLLNIHYPENRKILPVLLQPGVKQGRTGLFKYKYEIYGNT
jgi:hypothetical protein